MKKGDIVYFARILKPVGIYEVCELKIRVVEKTWFSAAEKSTHKAFIFSNNDIGKSIFYNRGEALDLVLEAEENKKPISNEKYYEEY